MVRIIGLTPIQVVLHRPDYLRDYLIIGWLYSLVSEVGFDAYSVPHSIVVRLSFATRSYFW